jgi:hypothetical protein
MAWPDEALTKIMADRFKIDSSYVMAAVTDFSLEQFDCAPSGAHKNTHFFKWVFLCKLLNFI